MPQARKAVDNCHMAVTQERYHRR